MLTRLSNAEHIHMVCPEEAQHRNSKHVKLHSLSAAGFLGIEVRDLMHDFFHSFRPVGVGCCSCWSDLIEEETEAYGVREPV